MGAGSNGTRKGLTPAPGAGGGAQNGDVPVNAHVVPCELRIARRQMRREAENVSRATKKTSGNCDSLIRSANNGSGSKEERLHG